MAQILRAALREMVVRLRSPEIRRILSAVSYLCGCGNVIAGLYLVDGQRQLDQLITITPFSSEALRDRKPDLPVEAQTRLANPPLPVGIVAAGASDGATRRELPDVFGLTH